MNIRAFIDGHYRHFNAATLREAAQAYEAHLGTGGHMMVTLAGAMSTAELGPQKPWKFAKNREYYILQYASVDYEIFYTIESV